MLDAYGAFWDDYIEVARTSDYRSPRLAEHATGDALRRLRYQLSLYDAQGLVARGRPVRTATQVTSISVQSATVAECLDSNKWLAHDAKTGKLRDKPSGKIRRVRATLSHVGEGWKVSKLDIGNDQCAAA